MPTEDDCSDRSADAAELPAGNGPTRNDIVGDVAMAVQAGAIAGGVHFHAAPPLTPSAASLPAQVVAGRLPHEPPHYQPLPQLATLDALASSGTAAVVCAVTGQRGVGKTQLAAAYARQRIRDGWPLVAWVGAETADELVAGLSELADALGLRRPEEDSAEGLVRLRQRLNARTDPGLIVFDNVADVAAVREHIPSGGVTQVVLTSTLVAAERLGRRVPVDTFEPDIAVRFLEQVTGLGDDAGARRVAAELGFLPLALAQAGARIRGAERSYDRYLKRLAGMPIERHLKRPRDDPYPRGAAEAILLALDSVRWNDGPDIRRWLSVLAVLSPDGVSRDLLADEDESDDLSDALEQLFEASIIEYAGDRGDAITMHRLVQRIIRDRSRADDMFERTIADAADRLGQATFPSDSAWHRRQEGDELVRHIEALWRATSERGSGVALAEKILALRNWAVEYVIGLRDPARARALAMTVHQDCQRIVGGENSITLSSASNLAQTYRLTGKLAEAIQLWEATVGSSGRILGSTHDITLAATVRLGNAYCLGGRHAEAVQLLEDVVRHRRRLLGDDDPSTLSSAHDLAFAYRSTGRYAEAITLGQDTLSRRRATLGDEHPDTLNSMNGLGFSYRAVGRVAEGIKLYESTLAARRRVLGPEHPQTLVSASNLAFAYATEGRLAESIALHELTFESRRRLLGVEHTSTLISASNLARSYGLAGRWDEAIAMHEDTLARRRAMLGDDHPTTLVSTNYLASAYATVDRLDEALALQEDTLARRQRLLGPDSPRTLNSMNALAAIYAAAGRRTEAIELYEHTLAQRRRLLGDDHPDTRESVAGLAAATQPDAGTG